MLTTRPDIEFHGADATAQAAGLRRIDPHRLAEEHARSPVPGIRARLQDGRLVSASMSADMPLRGRVPVVWRWDWSDESRPTLEVSIDGDILYRATGRWRELGADEAALLWTATPGAEPETVPGDRWPSRINMRRLDVADGVHLVRGVRTGFQHLVVETEAGLVVADAPAGWVEMHELPPTDMVPGLGISGLSENFIDFLRDEFPGAPIRAVALTHAHDDHAGGARAFAAARAVVFAPAEYARFLETAFNQRLHAP